MARGYHVVNIDIDSVYFLELPPYLDIDKEQAKSVNGRYFIREADVLCQHRKLCSISAENRYYTGLWEGAGTPLPLQSLALCC